MFQKCGYLFCCYLGLVRNRDCSQCINYHGHGQDFLWLSFRFYFLPYAIHMVQTRMQKDIYIYNAYTLYVHTHMYTHGRYVIRQMI